MCTTTRWTITIIMAEQVEKALGSGLVEILLSSSTLCFLALGEAISGRVL